jgi:hypothetical protein
VGLCTGGTYLQNIHFPPSHLPRAISHTCAVNPCCCFWRSPPFRGPKPLCLGSLSMPLGESKLTEILFLEGSGPGVSPGERCNISSNARSMEGSRGEWGAERGRKGSTGAGAEWDKRGAGEWEVGAGGEKAGGACMGDVAPLLLPSPP